MATTKKAGTTAVAVKDQANTALATYGNVGATGFEGADSSELAIPFINLLQSNSELVEAGKAKAGQFYNNVMETILDSFEIVPCARERVFVEWVPVDDGGGLVAVHKPDSDFVTKAIAANGGSTRDIKVADGKHDLVETIYVYVLLLGESGVPERAVISFSSSKLGRYRQFFTKASQQQIMVGDRRITLPMWAHKWTVGSEEQVSKRNGKKFKNITLDFTGGVASGARLNPDDPLALAGAEFHDMVIGGLAKADMSTMDKGDAPGAAGEADGEGNIPF